MQRIVLGLVENLAQSADRVYNGSYRYKDFAHIFLKEINKKSTLIVLIATNKEYITAFSPSESQMKLAT